MEPGAWRGCKAGSALESTCPHTISWGIDGKAVPRGLHGGNNIHFSRQWTLARCGHHFQRFQDSKIARHAQRHSPESLCGALCNTLLHAIRVCPLFDIQRHTLLEHLGLQRAPQFGVSELLRWIHNPHLVLNSHSAVSAHAHYVAAICQTARSLCEGLLTREP